MKFRLVALLLAAAAALSCAGAQPASVMDDEPKLAHALTVAKSPLEPVTLADQSAPAGAEHKLTTRALQTTVEQERENSASTSGLAESSGLSQEATKTIAESSTPGAESPSESPFASSSETSEAVVTTTTTTTTTTTEAPLAETSASPASDEREASMAPTTVAPFAPSSPASEATTPSAASESVAAVGPERVVPTSGEPAEEPTSEATTTTTTTTTTARPTTEPAAPEAGSSAQPEVAADDEPAGASVAGDKVEPELPAPPQPPAPARPSVVVVSLPSSTPAPTTPAPVETTESPATTPSPSPSPSPSPPPPPVASSTTPASEPKETSTPADEKKADEGKPTSGPTAAGCNHLPSYEADEMQKVFREETTYRNGTIKGKFTYVNFDQRYRLVHYTRLPYGPVKIDLVEELDKPDAAGANGSAAPAAAPPSLAAGSDLGNEVPNAVLQLRNVLPNSLFGFPFLGPQNSIALPVKPPGVGAGAGAGSLEARSESAADKENKYFYSTDSLSTPNLPLPSVPVAVPPSARRRVSAGAPVAVAGGASAYPPAADTLAQSYFENLPIGEPAPSSNKPALAQEPASASAAAAAANPAPGHLSHFQYASAASASQLLGSPETKHLGLVYSYMTQASSGQPPQYQYSPPGPLYTFRQPTYYRPAPAPAPAAPIAQSAPIAATSSLTRAKSDQLAHQTHQPHSHEHYIAPFMFVQPPSLLNDQPEASRLRLKVKTSKALNHPQEAPRAAHAKSAQLRAPSPRASLPSPVAVGHRQVRQRAGKQNHALRQQVNTNPVVYHVLRSPAGRVYSPLSNYESQPYSIAYDHDE